MNELLPEYANAGFILGIGGDQTDEDLFAHLPENAWTIHVGGGPSRAAYSIADTTQMRELLLQLTQNASRTLHDQKTAVARR